MKSQNLKTAIVLAGGLGTRLRSVISEIPKPMAPLAGRPFLAWLLDSLEANGLEHIILATGYKGEIIEQYFGRKYGKLRLSYSVEKESLGTGGAALQAINLVEEEAFFLLNGDTFFNINLSLLGEHFVKSQADLVLALKPMQSFDRYGVVDCNADGRVVAFKEKKYTDLGNINGGIYLVKKNILIENNFNQKFSFEKELLEAKLGQLNIHGVPMDSYFIDIGIPEDFERAQTELPAELNVQPPTGRALFLDRDGVINSRIVGDYVRTWAQFDFLPGSLEAIVSFRQKFDRIFIVTNQQGVGKGLMRSSEVEEVHQKMMEVIAAAGGHIDRAYFCPELASANPPCRKPNTGMALQAQKDFPEINFQHSIMVGDSASDIEMGRRLGMKLAFILGKEEDVEKVKGMELDWKVAKLADLKFEV